MALKHRAANRFSDVDAVYSITKETIGRAGHFPQKEGGGEKTIDKRSELCYIQPLES